VPVRKDHTGKRFGRLVALRYVGDYKYLCQCDCGNTATLLSINFTSGHTTSCGCRATENALKNCSRINADPNRPNNLAGFIAKVQNDPRQHPAYAHGMTATPEHRAYHGAIARCTNPHNKSFADYGGRGIEFRFKPYEEFFAELGPRPAGVDAKGNALYSLDRFPDNDGHYEPGNVRWATRVQQNSNQHKRKTAPKVRLQTDLTLFSSQQEEGRS
jgi:hypothetical protein